MGDDAKTNQAKIVLFFNTSLKKGQTFRAGF